MTDFIKKKLSSDFSISIDYLRFIFFVGGGMLELNIGNRKQIQGSSSDDVNLLLGTISSTRKTLKLR